ncbi:MAG TPA: hypothetical protein VGI39_33060 [Polyangiaceae bacterium]|jgi:hypothetical protein
MAEEVSSAGERVFESILAPLVLGGPMRPTRPVGARTTLALLDCPLRPSDSDLASRVDLARVAQARRLAPVDRVDELEGPVLALGAALHDLLQVTSPEWFRRSAPRRLLELTQAALEKVPPIASAREALERHTWFARVLEITRQDTSVRWWVGSQQFRGQEPPRRLLLWQDLRRVSVAKNERRLEDLLAHGGMPEHDSGFQELLGSFLRATPLTDLASAGRNAAPFGWSRAGLALTRTTAGRTLALRAASFGAPDATDAALGRATRVLVALKQWSEASTAIVFLAHRALAAAQTTAGWPGSLEGADDLSFARAAGAAVARRWLDDPQNGLAEPERRRLAPVLEAAAKMSAAREIPGGTGALRFGTAVTSAGSS